MDSQAGPITPGSRSRCPATCHVGLADPQPYYDRWGNRWRTLAVVDLLQAEADAFGHRSTGDFSLSYPRAGTFGTVWYAGGLIGTALNRAWLPPVLGNANLAVNLGTLDGRASFTSLAVYTNGLAEPFAGGRLHYPFALSENALVGTDPRSTFLADFYGPAHEEVAGTLHDPRAGLLASFGATYDDRPVRGDVLASADYLFGRSVLARIGGSGRRRMVPIPVRHGLGLRGESAVARVDDDPGPRTGFHGWVARAGDRAARCGL